MVKADPKICNVDEYIRLIRSAQGRLMQRLGSACDKDRS